MPEVIADAPGTTTSGLFMPEVFTPLYYTSLYEQLEDEERRHDILHDVVEVQDVWMTNARDHAGLAHHPGARRVVVEHLVDQFEAAACGECPSSALDDGHLDVGIPVDCEPYVGEVAVHLGVHRVQARSIQDDAQDAGFGPPAISST